MNKIKSKIYTYIVLKGKLYIPSGKPKVFKESWWWNDEEEKMIKDKNKRFKELMAYTEKENRIKKERSIEKQSGRQRKR